MIAMARQMHAFEVSNPHIVYMAAPVLLVERANAPEEAEALARAGVEFVSSYYLAYRRGETIAELEAISAPLLSEVHQTIGEVLLRRAKVDEAMVELKEAIKLDARNAGAHLLLGTILRKRGDLEKARDHLLLAHEHAAREDRAEVESALLELLEASGKSQSFREFLDEQVAHQAERRKQRILAKRQRGPKIMGLEGLVPLGNEPESLATDGKIVIVNVWTTYCKPCIEEMPELERLWDTYYANDPEVEMFTVSADLNPDDARSFRERHGYRIPAYHDGGFADRMGVRVFPTTLFFDRTGHLTFRSLDQARADEFSWRIDALR
jgi:thiol-disulfide isomerase/thioredoxin